MTVKSIIRHKLNDLVTASGHDVLLTRVKCLTRHDTGVLVVRDHAARLLGTLAKLT